jgi:hypothetical protein
MRRVASDVPPLRPWILQTALLASCIFAPAPLAAQVLFEQPPIDYYNAEPHDPVWRLQKKMDAGEAKLQLGKLQPQNKLISAENYVQRH